MKQNKINLSYVLLFWAIFIFFIISISTPIVDNDTLFHIKIGEWVVQNRQVPTKDMFSMHDLNYTAYAYLFDVIVYFFYVMFGIQGMVILKYLYWTSFSFLAAVLVKKLSNKNFVEAFFWIFIITLGVDFYNIRPAMASYIVLLIQLYIMNKWAKNQDSKIIYWIPLTFLILNNLHGGVFLFHLFVVCAFGLELFIEIKNSKIYFKNFLKNKNFKKCLIIMFLCIVSLFITPNGVKIMDFSLGTVDLELTNYIAEWLEPTVSKILIFIFLTILYIKLVDLNKMPITNLLILTVCFVLGISSYRFIPYIAVGLIFIVSYCDFSIFRRIIYLPDVFIKTFNKTSNKMLLSITIFIASVFLLYFSIISGNISMKWDFNDEKAFVNVPVEAVEYMKEHDITTNLYNNYDIGGYLLFNNIDVFIDARCDLYDANFNDFEDDIGITDDFISVFLEKDKTFKYLMDKYNLEYALLMDYEFFLLDSLANYEILYEDEESKVVQYFGDNNS